MPEVQLTVRHYRGIDHAELMCSPIALLYADNGAGKSSIAEAVAATLSGEGLLGHPELKKATSDRLVQRGTQAGSARVKTTEGEVRMLWPGCEAHSDGIPPRASQVALGMVSIPEIKDDKARALMIDRYLRADPTKEDLTLEMAERFAPASIEQVWREIESFGWDGVQSKYETERRDAGRDWSKITGENFGSDKAQSWRPQGWDEAMEDEDPKVIEQELATATADLAAATKNAAVDEAELASLRNYANRVPELQGKATEAQLAFDQADEAFEAAVKTRNALPASADISSLKCPHCSGALQITGKPGQLQLEKHQGIDPEKLRETRLQIGAADGALSKANTDRRRRQEDLITARGELSSASRAADQLKQLTAERGAGPGSPGSVHQAQERVDRLTRTLTAMTCLGAAVGLYRKWLRADLIIQIARPDGLRGRVLGRAVEAFNSGVLAPLCEGSNWPRVTLTPELHVTGHGEVGELPYSLLSAGEKWRVRLVLQIACAKIDGSSMVLLDNLTDLDSDAINVALSLLVNEEMPALVCVASRLGKPPPPIAKFGYGNTYVIQGRRAVLYQPDEDEAEAA
jgi:hypothetical protein